MRDNGLANSEVIPLSHIARTCHLSPKFGSSMPDHTFMPLTVLQSCIQFYLNPWISLHDFHLICAM